MNLKTIFKALVIAFISCGYITQTSDSTSTPATAEPIPVNGDAELLLAVGMNNLQRVIDLLASDIYYDFYTDTKYKPTPITKEGMSKAIQVALLNKQLTMANFIQSFYSASLQK